MKKIILWGQPLVNRVVKKGAPVVATHNVTEPLPPIHIISIDRIVTGTCEYPQSGTCVATSQYEVMGTEFTAPVTLVWSVSAGATITAGQGTKIITVTTDSNTNTTYDVTCVATDISGSDTKTETFTDVRTMEPPITITSITRTGGGSCEYPSAGVCASTSNFTVAYTNATGTVTYNWVITGQAVLQSGQGTQNITVLTDQSNTNITYNVSCTVTDSNSTDTEVQPFTDTRTPEPVPVYRIAVATTGYASRSTDNGATWTALTQGLNSGSETASFYSVAANGNTWVAGANNGYASRSTDNGATWTALTQGLNSGYVNANLRSVYANGNTWVAAGDTGYASRSTDNGATWTALTKGLNSGYSSSAFRSVVANGNTWVAVSNAGNASRSTDDGATWTTLPGGLNSGSAGAAFNSVAANGNTWIAYADSGYASRSTDDGASWTALTKGLNSGTVSASFKAGK